ncbi:hypothetical protein [Asaccharospora irregularis]|uniref:Uncharacterized protein n=1 Tax=Asaccharospora irregularis DSM 2635 TaxID=1121321 RepID=A0A1M5JMJ9_9FIRM|nr:hypothetical protein [Asaccharospora irregularis]SHG41253.1 hypothetical protein SAMN04488530_101198 [Asaccharospora irregularis DSM 2635]
MITAIKNKYAEIYRFLSLSLTALTVCALYFDGDSRVIKEDWGGLVDIMPTMSKALWVLVILSIAVNSVSILKYKRLNEN